MQKEREGVGKNTGTNLGSISTKHAVNVKRIDFGYPSSVIRTYEGGLCGSLNTFISLQILGVEQANNPHMKAMHLPFHMRYSSLIYAKGLHRDMPKC